jgi:hypothetical protein
MRLERRFVGLADGQTPIRSTRQLTPRTVGGSSVPDDLTSSFCCCSALLVGLLAIGLGLGPGLLRPIERQVLVDHLEGLWTHAVLQSGSDDLTNGCIIEVVLRLEPTDSSPQSDIGVSLSIAGHHLVDDLLLLIESLL